LVIIYKIVKVSLGLLLILTVHNEEAVANTKSLCSGVPMYSQKGWFKCVPDKKVNGYGYSAYNAKCTIEEKALKKIFGDSSFDLSFSGLCAASFYYSLPRITPEIVSKLSVDKDGVYLSVKYDSILGCVQYIKVNDKGSEIGSVNRKGKLKRFKNLSNLNNKHFDLTAKNCR